MTGVEDWDEPDDEPYEDDEPDYDPDPLDDYEPDPADHPDVERYEAARYLRSLSPLGRVRYRLSSLVWRHTWRWRIARHAGEPGYDDEPPF